MIMTTQLKFPVYLLAIATLWSGTLTSQAGVPGIQDNAGFFSETAKADAGYNISELQKSLKKDLSVETFWEIPAEEKQGVDLQDKVAVNRVCQQWAVKRARAQSVNGVYIMLVKEPAHLQVVVGNETQKRAFTLADRDELVRTMLAKLRAKDYDAALREGMSFVVSTMKANAGSHSRATSTLATTYRDGAQPESSGGSARGWFWSLLIIGGLVWLGLSVVRSLFRSGSAGAGGAMNPAADTGGGGFFRNMLGGMFGAAAGMWMYNNFFGSHGSSAHGADHGVSSGEGINGDAGFSGQDTDYTSSGGGFGDDSGGGFGGGDFGGGGDSGGGGGDF